MKEQIKQIMEQVFRTEIHDGITQTDCPNWDSLRHLNLIVELELAFDVSFEPEEISRMKDIPTIETIIASKR